MDGDLTVFDYECDMAFDLLNIQAASTFQAMETPVTQRRRRITVHESRVDGSMLLGSIFLLIVGAGLWSLDFSWLVGTERKRRERDAT
jgi:hypothetical protein